MQLIRRLAFPLALVLCGSLFKSQSLAAPLAMLAATYTVPTPPQTLVQGVSSQVTVLVQNTGDETWPSAGPNAVNLSYHWYDAGGTTVVWDGARTPLGGDSPAGTTRSLSTTVVAPAFAGAYTLRFALVKEGIAWIPPSAPFGVIVSAPTYTATYQLTAPPTQVPAGGTFQLPATVTNTGNQIWNATGPDLVDLAYHWYDASGANAVVWDGGRTPLGGDLAPNATRSLVANIAVPNVPGMYTLRLALVKEGVAWFAPSSALSVNAATAYVAAITAPTLPSFVAGGTYQVAVPVRNGGLATWNFAGQNPIELSYHWHDGDGNTVVWDGLRTPLPADISPTAVVTLTARIAAPLVAGTYTLTLDLVREGVGWFTSLGSTPYKVQRPVEAMRFGASYALPASVAAYWAEAKTANVSLTNTGNQIWSASGAAPVNVAYHVFDGDGNTVVWDGVRTSIGGDLAPGGSRTIAVAFTAPATSGTYTLAIDLVREGIGWFQDGGSPPARIAFIVTSGLAAGYGASTTPGQVTIGATVDLLVTVLNYGPRTWQAGGPNPVHLSYHISGANSGTMYTWDGARAVLPTDVPASAQTTVPIRVALPATVGDYVLAWDLVQEGVAWFSGANVASKREPVTVVAGAVFYGSGNGHGVGLSQYGANGYATGAAGRALTGEQIIQKYFPGTALQFGDVTRPNNRVLLSQPSSQARYRCGTNSFFAGAFGDVVSGGGFRVLDEGAGNAEIGRVAPTAKWQFVATAGLVHVWNNGGAAPIQIGNGFTSVAVVPLDPNQPLRFVQKDQLDGRPGLYRGNLRFTNLGDTLRVVNVLSYDDYTRGVVSFEMPNTWQAEALRAQAYAARSYAYAQYRGGVRDYDVGDDQSDQCYGGVAAEGPRTDAAVASTAGKLVTYQGVIAKTYFSSSSGGYTLEFGCWGNRVVRSGGTWVCTPDATQPYLAAVPDPGDRLVASPPNPRASWTVTFNGPQIVQAVICAGGPNIGVLQGLDLSNQSPLGVGHVISVRAFGTNANADVRAEDMLKTCLGLRSTLVRLAPF